MKQKKRVQGGIQKGPTHKKKATSNESSAHDTIYLSRDDVERYKRYGRL